MELTIKQEEGLKIILNKHKNRDKYVVVSGYAGTGKSTLVKFAIDALQVNPSKVAYACYTGKAAEVLRKKGNQGACTLHKLLYDHMPMPGGGFYRKEKTALEVDIVVVDEVSLCPKSMIDLLLKHNVFVIFLGDPFQLPQIDKKEAHTLLDNPDIFLDEIMRQAAESEIIRLTLDIREGKSLTEIKGNEVCILNSKELNTGMLTWADQILVAKNTTRFSINNQVRHLLGYEGALPHDGERIICKRNYWDDCNSNGDALVNGSTGIIKNPFESFRAIPRYIKNDRHQLPTIIGNFIPDGGEEFHGIEMDRDFFLKEEPCIEWRVAYQLGKLKPRIGDVIPKEFTYAYSITTHAAQGSEWDKVLVIEENFPFDKTEHARWLYTAATRASSKLVLVR